MKTPVESLLRVPGIGDGSALWTADAGGSPGRLSARIKRSIRQHKPALLNMMRLAFLIVSSRVLNDAVLLFVPDEATKESLVIAGADRSAIYTKNELGALVARQVTSRKLRLIHEAKRRFNGKLAPSRDTL